MSKGTKDLLDGSCRSFAVVDDRDEHNRRGPANQQGGFLRRGPRRGTPATGELPPRVTTPARFVGTISRNGMDARRLA